MTAFRLLLVALAAILVIYTAVVIGAHGWNLFPIFFGDIGKMGWPGQFNTDFTMMLLLSALWTAWRNRFSAIGIVLALLAMNLGTLFLATYLLYLSWKEHGDMARVLVGGRLGSGY